MGRAGELDTVNAPAERGETAVGGDRLPARRWVLAMVMLLLLTGGFLGGVVTTQFLGGCLTCALRPGSNVVVTGSAESLTGGVLSVRTDDGAVVVVRTAPTTRVLREQAQPGGTPISPGSLVRIQAYRDTDGALSAEVVGVTGS